MIKGLMKQLCLQAWKDYKNVTENTRIFLDFDSQHLFNITIHMKQFAKQV